MKDERPAEDTSDQQSEAEYRAWLKSPAHREWLKRQAPRPKPEGEPVTCDGYLPELIAQMERPAPTK